MTVTLTYFIFKKTGRKIKSLTWTKSTQHPNHTRLLILFCGMTSLDKPSELLPNIKGSCDLELKN